MTRKRRLKRAIRERAKRDGVSYSTARRNMGLAPADAGPMKSSMGTAEPLIVSGSGTMPDSTPQATPLGVFLSHAWEDKAFVRRLARFIERKGFSVWLDERTLRGGDTMTRVIAEGLAASDVVVVVLSTASAKSRWLQFELNNVMPRVIDEECKLIPVLLEGGVLPVELNGRFYVDFRTNVRHAYRQIHQALKTPTPSSEAGSGTAEEAERPEPTKREKLRRDWDKSNLAWKRFRALSPIEVLQYGWVEREFSERDVEVVVEREFKLDPEIQSEIYEKHVAEWTARNMKDNPQCGVFEVDTHRLSDDPQVGPDPTHLLLIRAHKYSYFQFLSTNRAYWAGAPEREFLRKYVRDADSSEPVPAFANPLSVGLSLFAEGGDVLALSWRTRKVSSGGHLRAGRLFNAVGENVTWTADVVGESDGRPTVSPLATARRGLREEMGIEVNSLPDSKLLLHSFCWDREVLDYKFFGYLRCDLSAETVRRSWENAPDRAEHSSLEFRQVATRPQCLELLRDIVEHQEKWTPEGTSSSVLSLLHLRKLQPEDIEDVLSSPTRES